MLRDYINFTQTYVLDNTTAALQGGSYQSLKTDIISKIKTSVDELNLGFTVASEDSPNNANAAAQTINIVYNTPFRIEGTINYTFRIQIVFNSLTTAQASGITIRSGLMRGSVEMIVHTAPTIISSWQANTISAAQAPTEITADINSIMLYSENCIAFGIRRANFNNNPITSVIPAATYSMYRYRNLISNELLWGGISSGITNQPLQTIQSALVTLGFSAGMQYGFIPAVTAEINLMSISMVGFNETNANTASTRHTVEDCDDFIIALAPNPNIQQSTKLSVAGEDAVYWNVCNFLNKMALIKE